MRCLVYTNAAAMKWDAIRNHSCQVTEIAGSSSDGVDESIRNGVAGAARTLRGLEEFDMQSVIGRLS
jgi:flavin-binding protein dodecin